MPYVRTAQRESELFWAKVGPVNKNGCRLWQASFFPQTGYGCFNRMAGGVKRAETAHRMAWLLTNGPIADGLHVCHTCDIRACCNPDHLFLGTPMDNRQDCKRKGRGNHGEKNGRAKRTEKWVMRLRRAQRAGATWAQLSVRFGVSEKEVYQVVSGANWKHLPVYYKPRKPWLWKRSTDYLKMSRSAKYVSAQTKGRQVSQS